MTYSDHRLLDALMRNDFLSFVAKVFHELNPGKTLDRNWHHEAMAYWIEVTAITGELRKSIISLPPRSLKSIMISVALPAFLLGRDPTKRIIVVSYNQDLANTFSRHTRQIMRTAWYRRLFPSTKLLEPASATQFYTASNGYRVALSTGGTFTGRGGDLIIIDDPMKADDAYSLSARAAVASWATDTLFSRLDDKRTGQILVVAQRLHEDDLIGHLLRSGGWAPLSLPSIAEKDERFVLSRNPLRFHDRKVGDLLDSKREPQHILDDLKRLMGTTAFLAQYQQAPVPPDGDIIKVGWFRTYDRLPDGGRRILSIDTAMKAGLRNDWSVAMVWRVVENRYYLEYIWRRRVEFPELLHLIIDLARNVRPDTILIEDKGHGTGLLQTLRADEEGFPAVAYDPGSLDKESRMRIQSARIEGGQVFLPPEAPWLDDFVDEVRRFPNGTHDDQIDAMSQVLDHCSRQIGRLLIIR